MPTLVVCDQCGQTAMVLFAMAELAVQRHNAACLAPRIDRLQQLIEAVLSLIEDPR
jgi:hypothetical protein